METVAVTGPLTRAVLDGIYFDVIRASGQGDQLQIELRAHNTREPTANVAPGRAKGIRSPALFAKVFNEQGGNSYADQLRIANVTSNKGYLPQTMLVTGVPTSMVLTRAGSWPAAKIETPPTVPHNRRAAPN